MMRKFGFVVLALVGAAAPALAADQNGYQAIVSGDLAAAERHILAEQAVYPGRPELMLNLAAVYRRTSRSREGSYEPSLTSTARAARPRRRHHQPATTAMTASP